MTGSFPRLQLGVIGCGRVFERYHSLAIMGSGSVDLLAACDPDPARLAWARDRFPGAALFGSTPELLGCPGLEAVLILTPPKTHAGIAIRALESGLHVLVEKPMALQPGDARRMAKASRLSQRRLQVGFNRRFREPYRRLRSMIRRLEPGQLRSSRFELVFPATSWQARTDFLGDEARGGGGFDDVLSHQVDLLCWVLGARPDEVRAEVGGSSREAVSAELRVGAMVAQCHAAHGAYAERLEIELSNGSVLEASGSSLRGTGTRFPAWRRRRALVFDRVALIGHRLLRRPNVTLTSFERQLKDFEHAVLGRSTEGATAEDGLLAVEIVQACRESAREGGAWQALKLGAMPAA